MVLSRQIGPLAEHGRCPHLLSLLQHARADEVHHKEDAAARAGGGGDGDGGPAARTLAERSWASVVRIGSAIAAEIARRV